LDPYEEALSMKFSFAGEDWVLGYFKQEQLNFLLITWVPLSDLWTGGKLIPSGHFFLTLYQE
jgi:hypothetical protein